MANDLLSVSDRQDFADEMQDCKNKIDFDFWERFLKPKKVRSVVYTCLTGGYDSLKEHRYIDNDWDYVCFTDNKELLAQKKCGIWEIRPLAYVGADNTRSSRYHKINPHKLFPDYE